METPPRLDKYLWAIRVFKTRSDAADACRSGKVTINDMEAKPSREVRVGDVLKVRRGPVHFRYQVLGLLAQRVGAKNLTPYVLDTTPPEELAKGQKSNEALLVWRDRGTGRPTKKERRDIDKLMEQL
ncbi:MAG: RNA-binding S4 domain-containing protein [Bacteroidetes bacterium]|nr:RNA-binding S4 domain-containing protein [Bacteroidota bacterium]